MAKFLIYHCYGGAHSSVTSAGIHLGLLPRHRVPSTGEILMIPHYDGDEPIPYGHFRFMGRDAAGRAVFALGKSRLGPRVSGLLTVVAGIYGRAGDFIPVDTTAPINFFMMFGGYVSRSLKLVGLGRPFVVLGTKLAYFKFVRLAGRPEERPGSKSLPSGMPRKAVFYLCPEGFRYPLLTARIHVDPRVSDGELLRWARRQRFTGTVGSLLCAGVAGDRRVYVMGAGCLPHIVGRIIRELRCFMDVPRSECLVLDPVIEQPCLASLAARACRRLGLGGLYRSWEGIIFKRMISKCRQESSDVKERIEEGILD
jgi:hypothetical protein